MRLALLASAAAIPLFQRVSAYVVRQGVGGYRQRVSSIAALSVWQRVYIKE